MRKWSVQISMLDSQGKEHPAKILDKVTYTLHPTFANPIRTLKQQPFRVEEQGWGDLIYQLQFISWVFQGKLVNCKIQHDLTFYKRNM